MLIVCHYVTSDCGSRINRIKVVIIFIISFNRSAYEKENIMFATLIEINDIDNTKVINVLSFNTILW